MQVRHPFLQKILKTAAPARLRRQPSSRAAETPFGHIPGAPGGATLVYPEGSQSSMAPLLHGMMQSSVLAQPGAVFLVGLKESEIHDLYPTAQRLEPTEKVGRISMSPSSAMTTLRVLLGNHELSDLLLELVYLEHAGNELSKTGPLAMIPAWVKEQLS